MITPIEIPKLTLTMDGGTLVKWLKQEGEAVEKDELLFELETDKTLVEVSSPAHGLLKKILVREGTVTVGMTVAFIGEAADRLPDVAADASTGGPAMGRVSSPDTERPPLAGMDKVRATPAARRRARELGLSLGSLAGTGPEGRITEEDVERQGAHSAGRPPSPLGDHRRLIAERTSNTWRTVPHIHIGGDLAAGGILQALQNGRKLLGPGLSITDLLLYATASLLGEFKMLNALWRGSQIQPQSRIHLAFAVQTDFGVMVPVIHDADRLSLEALSTKRKKLTEQARMRHLDLAELEGGTFTLTNLGMYPVDFFAPLINHPQTAILATGRIRQVPAVRGTEITAEWRMWANLAIDHRVGDGATAAQFLRRMEESFEALASRI